MKFEVLCRNLLEYMDLNQSKQHELNDIIQKYSTYLQINVDVLSTSGTGEPILKLANLRAKKDSPKGIGSEFMKELCKWADQYRITLILQTASKGDFDKKTPYKQTSSTDRLKKFYSRFGFVSNYGKRSYRSDLSGNMHRNPKA